MTIAEGRKEMPRWFHAAVEWGPAAVFFFVYQGSDLYRASAAVMAATAIAFALSWIFSRRIPVMPCVALLLVVVFGGLTLWLQSEVFIKILPSLVKLLFAAILFVGYAWDRPVLRHAIGAQMPDISAPAWRRLTLRYALFFAALAGLNELVWRSQSSDTWVAFNSYGDLGLLLLFIASQVPFVGRHRIDAQTEQAARVER